MEDIPGKKYIVIFGNKSVSNQDLQKQHLCYSELSYLWMYTFCTLEAQQRGAHYFAIIPNYSATLRLCFFQNRDNSAKNMVGWVCTLGGCLRLCLLFLSVFYVFI